MVDHSWYKQSEIKLHFISLEHKYKTKEQFILIANWYNKTLKSCAQKFGNFSYENWFKSSQLKFNKNLWYRNLLIYKVYVK